MEHIATTAVVSFAVLFPVVNPIAKVPQFMGLTEDMRADERHGQAARAAGAAAALLVVYLLAGHWVLTLFGVSLAAVEFVGGLIVGWTGWEMAVADPVTVIAHEPGDTSDVSFYPLAFPLIAGPGSLAIMLATSNRFDSNLDFGGALIGIGAVCLVTFLAMRAAEPISDAIGHKGIEVVTRIMGLLVLAIAAELIFHGIADHFGLEIID